MHYTVVVPPLWYILCTRSRQKDKQNVQTLFPTAVHSHRYMLNADVAAFVLMVSFHVS